MGQGPVFGMMNRQDKLVGAHESGELAVAVEEGFLFVLIENGSGDPRGSGDVLAHSVTVRIPATAPTQFVRLYVTQ